MDGRSTEDKKLATTVERRADRELVITRIVRGPARLVFEAWTKPELIARWWAPRSMGMTLSTCEVDLRVGGRYRYVFDLPGAPPFECFGHYLEVTPPSRLSWTNEEQGEAGAISTVTFEEMDGRTRVELSELYPSKEALDATLASGACEGTRETFAQLEEFIASLDAT